MSPNMPAAARRNMVRIPLRRDEADGGFGLRHRGLAALDHGYSGLARYAGRPYLACVLGSLRGYGHALRERDGS